MILNGLGITALTVYIGWNIHVLMIRYEKEKRHFSLLLTMYTCYLLMMISLLFQNSLWFLYIIFIVTLLNIASGFYIVMFKPHVASLVAMKSYWSYLAIDFIVGTLAYYIITHPTT